MAERQKLSTESYKGVRDFYPADLALLNYMHATFRNVLSVYGYEEYSASILEPSELYKTKGADNEEIINEQTYTFVDRGEREVTLRPEMTPTVARMVAAKKRDLGFPLRWWSFPNCFRYERPQRGRLREFWQLNFDIFGSSSLHADAEIIVISHALLRTFGGKEEDFTIKIGSRSFLDSLTLEYGLDGKREANFRTLLDKRSKMSAEEFEQELKDFGVPISALSPETPPHDVAEVLRLVAAQGVGNAVFDPSIVRGFSYYTGIVFEVFDNHPKNNRAMFGGGRYDNLLRLFSDEPLPAVGCAPGDVTLRDFLEVRGLLPTYTSPTKVYLATPEDALLPEASRLAEELRAQGVACAVDFGERKLGDQIKAAAKNGVPYLVVVGGAELQSGTFVVRDLHSGSEEKMSREQLHQFFLNI